MILNDKGRYKSLCITVLFSYSFGGFIPPDIGWGEPKNAKKNGSMIQLNH